MDRKPPQPTDSWPLGKSGMAKRVRAHDWSATPLGPIENWPAELRSAVALVLESGFPSAVVWGPGFVTIPNDNFAPLLGNELDALGRSFAEIWGEAWHHIGPITERAYAGETTFVEDFPLLIDRSGEQEEAFFTFSYSPVREENGTVLGMIDTAVETTQRVRASEALREAEKRQHLLLNELQHRVRNALAVLRSIARRTTETSETVEDYAMHLQGRIDAFARVQSAAVSDPSVGVDLAMLIADELLMAAVREGDRLTIDGPNVRLQPKAAELFALIIHELTTNAIKYGALTVPKGRIRVAWKIEANTGGNVLVMVWQERGMQNLRAPTRSGFGTELLERTLPYQLNGSAVRAFEANGLRCTITVPLNDRIARLS
ncbi:PAS domain-containing protein [Afifella sp. JA880]|uniref:sensor histidine kinase n=1 Tax=Afifella sp. JA880 TaxID=2975280 RepID=UPI0021BAABA9|nr:PAS domain-containing sensor histidine kinase [Afifella sp. JA880]MCT8266279.1 PAS domain-containing protein [Afifella sp. JA880]